MSLFLDGGVGCCCFCCRFSLDVVIVSTLDDADDDDESSNIEVSSALTEDDRKGWEEYLNPILSLLRLLFRLTKHLCSNVVLTDTDNEWVMVVGDVIIVVIMNVIHDTITEHQKQPQQRTIPFDILLHIPHLLLVNIVVGDGGSRDVDCPSIIITSFRSYRGTFGSHTYLF